MRSSLEVGDEVVTAGGIIGRVVIIKDDTIVIETGNDRSKIPGCTLGDSTEQHHSRRYAPVTFRR